MINLLLHFLYSSVATLFFALIMTAPKKSLIPAALLGGIGYAIYEGVFLLVGHEIFGYFCGTVFIASVGEVFARKLKMPSIVFIFPAIVPLVPGIGLYKTMLTLVENRPSDFLTEGVNTLFIGGTIAVSLAIINVVARLIPHGKHSSRK